MDFHIGFTGSREGMSTYQIEQLYDFLSFIVAQEFVERIFFHHGDCVGSDNEAHQTVRSLFPQIIVVVHPPVESIYRSFCGGDEIRPPKPYILRNHDIVNESRWVVVAPLLPEAQQPRSGTWATYRYAKNKKKRVALLKREP